MRAEIRCCCNPGKLLGTVEAPDDQWPRVRFSLRHSDKADEPTFVELEWGKLAKRGSNGMALKSMNTPIELLRRIPSFKEPGR